VSRSNSVFWILGAAAVLYILTAPRFYVGHFQDDARDILAAKALLSGSYSNLQLPGRPPLNFPLPGFPLFLAPFVALLSSCLPCLKVIPIAFTLGSVWLARRLWEPELSGPASDVLLAICAFNPLTVALSSQVIADSAYLFVVLSACVLLRHPQGRRRDALLCLAAGWALLLRPEGSLLLLALAGALLWTKQWESLITVSSSAWLLIGLLVWNYVRTGHATGYGVLLNETLPFLSRGPATLAAQTATLLKTLVLDLLCGISIEPQTFLRFVFVWGLVAGAMATALAGWIKWVRSPRAPQVLAVGASLYAALHLGLHGAWLAVDPHYLWPLLPFIVFAVIYAVETIPGKRTRQLTGAFLLFVLFASYAWQIRHNFDPVFHPSPEDRLPTETFEWIRSHTSPDAFFLSPQAAPLTLYTGRHSLAFIGGADPDDFRYRLLAEGITHVAMSPFAFLHVQALSAHDPAAVWRHSRVWLASHPEAYEPVYRSDREAIEIYRARPAPDFQNASVHYRRIMETLSAQSNPDWLSQMDQLERVIQVYPLPAALNAYGVAALFSGRHLATARLRLKEAVRQDQNYGVAWLNLARVAVRLGDRVHARQAYDQVLERFKDDQDQAFLIPIALRERQTL